MFCDTRLTFGTVLHRMRDAMMPYNEIDVVLWCWFYFHHSWTGVVDRHRRATTNPVFLIDRVYSMMNFWNVKRKTSLELLFLLVFLVDDLNVLLHPQSLQMLMPNWKFFWMIWIIVIYSKHTIAGHISGDQLTIHLKRLTSSWKVTEKFIPLLNASEDLLSV